jgi:hypothetical protein
MGKDFEGGVHWLYEGTVIPSEHSPGDAEKEEKLV